MGHVNTIGETFVQLKMHASILHFLNGMKTTNCKWTGFSKKFQ